MGGVFMRKIIKRIGILAALVCLVLLGTLIADRQTLHEELIRLHVVAASDSAEDQQIKLSVRDAVLQLLGQALADATDMEQAKAYIQTHLPQIEAAANDALVALGVTDQAVVSFTEEAFPTRVYDTFSLPSGVYESLRITIGQGEGHNWWCVVFPRLCMPAAAEGVEDVAAGAGFSDSLTDTLTRKQGYEVRFFFLDVLGKIENFFQKG